MTTVSHAEVLEALFAAVDEVNSTLPRSERLLRSADLKLHGEGSALDSLSLINLLIAAEETLESRFGRSPQLTLELENLSSDRLRTLGHLANFIHESLG